MTTNTTNAPEASAVAYSALAAAAPLMPATRAEAQALAAAYRVQAKEALELAIAAQSNAAFYTAHYPFTGKAEEWTQRENYHRDCVRNDNERADYWTAKAAELEV